MSPNRLIPSPPTVKVVDEEVTMKQGIVTILGSDCERSKAKSIRRTLSADMSSKKWLQQNGFFSPVKKMSCSSSSSSSESEEEYEKIPGQDDVWRSIQAEKERNEGRKPADISVWGSILTQKSESSCLPPPYVHPLVKRSASSLSEKSLEICTESLGSETGSDCFSSYSLSDGDEDKERERAVREECSKDLNPFPGSHVAKYKKSPARHSRRRCLPFPAVMELHSTCKPTGKMAGWLLKRYLFHQETISTPNAKTAALC
ncbi:UNVERIFIED_CONTAM: protein FAF-like, chloroplastic [Sesamum latifolium]|uniref:Protein FAF-like, chloroplastic n=1 Tax=Sesamum latifolium TaxID=2727402 RepID=A0AAW2Y2R1_9LAMI